MFTKLKITLRNTTFGFPMIRFRWKQLICVAILSLLAIYVLLASHSGGYEPSKSATRYKVVQSQAEFFGYLQEADATISRLAHFDAQVDCDAVRANDSAAIEQAKTWEYDSYSNDAVWQEIEKAPDQCRQLKMHFFFPSKAFSPEEEAYPLAFGALVHRHISQVTYMLSALYQPQNVFVVAVDGKANNDFKNRMDIIADCLPNVYVMHQQPVQWCGYQIVRAVTSGLQLLSNLNHTWKYYQYLSGVDMPLKTNLEMVRILKNVNGAFLSEITAFPSNRLKTEIRSPMPLFKSSLSATVPRAAADAIVKSPLYEELLIFLKRTYCPDEAFWTTLAGNPQLLPVPGGFDGRVLMEQRYHEKGSKDKNTKPRNLIEGFLEPHYYISRYQVWVYQQPLNKTADLPTCHGQLISSSCVFGVQDVPYLSQAPEMLVHKLYFNMQPAAYFCLLRNHYRRSFDSARRAAFTGQAYRSLAQAEYLRGVPIRELRFFKHEA